MKFFEKIYNYIKNLFIKREEKEIKEQSKEIEFEEEVVDDSSLSEIKIGDVIWAKRYRTEEEMLLIEEGHREGPFIVININKDGLICTRGTSVEIKENKQDVYYTLPIGNYILHKETNFKLRDFMLIDDSTYIKKIGALEKNDFSRFLKTLKMAIKFNKNIKEEVGEITLPLDSSDIIVINNKKYIVLDMNEEKFRCIPFEGYKENLEMIDFKDLDFSKIIEFEKNTKYKIIDKINNNILKYLLKKEREYIQNILNQKVIQRGSVLSKGNKYYYVYGEDGQELLVFEITIYKNPKDEEIILNGRRYYSNFKNLKIKKSKDLDPLFLTSEDDMNKVKHKRINYKKLEKEEEEYIKKPHLRLNVGEIIESRNLRNRRFIIIGVKPKTYECLSINKLKQGIYEDVLIRKEDTRISKNKSLDGIKWFEDNPDFNLENINKNGVIKQILNKQLKYIENTKLEKQTEEFNKELTESKEFYKIKPGMIIKHGEVSSETFVVKSIIGNLVECTSSLDGRGQKIQSYFFDKSEVIIVEKQKRK